MNLKRLYRDVGLSYLLGQVIIFLILIYINSKHELLTLNTKPIHLIYPGISLILFFVNLILFQFLISKLHLIAILWFWISMFVPLIMPAFLNKYDIFYSVWIFILCTTTVGTVLFRDICLYDKKLSDKNREGHRILYDELKYYLDKLASAWLTLGSVFTIIATILWSASSDIMNVSLYERTNINLFMVFSFALETFLVGIFTAIPILKKMNYSRNILLNKKQLIE